VTVLRGSAGALAFRIQVHDAIRPQGAQLNVTFCELACSWLTRAEPPFWRLRRPVGTAGRAAHERSFFGVGKAACGRGRSLAQVRICGVQQGRFESRACRVI
jgi:hypothetical protein